MNSNRSRAIERTATVAAAILLGLVGVLIASGLLAGIAALWRVIL